MKTPSDGWDRDEREVVDRIARDLETVRARHAADPPSDVLRAGAAGVLPEALEESVNRHLAGSPFSRALVEGLDAADVTLDETDQARLLKRIQKGTTELAPRPRGVGWFRQPAFAAAALVILAGAAWIGWRTWSAGRLESPQPEATVTRQVPPPAPAYRLALTDPSIRLSLAALTFRGPREDALAADLKPAFDALRRRDYAAAERELSALAPKYPDAVEVHYYQGVSRLFTNDTRNAIVSLTAAERIGDASFQPDIAWYLAVASERAGDIDQARRRLKVICDTGASRAADACDGLKQLQ
jgi:hypothetical protein